MKIALLNDFKTYAGAETSIKQRLAAKPKSIDVDFLIPEDVIEFEKYDAFILENIVMFKPAVLENIIGKRPYIKVEHDFNYCPYRNQIQCKACEMPCPVQYNPQIRALYENAKIIIAASPVHMKFQQDQLQGWNTKYTFNLPYTYKQSDIPKVEVERKPKTVAYLGTMKAHKGIYDILNLATRKTDYHFDLAGRHGIIKGQMPPNVSYIGEVADKWKYLAQHEYFIHIPRNPDPCPGTIIEAILMGCKIIHNDFVGMMSYNFNTKEQWLKALEESGPRFWRIVTETFNK